MKFQEAEKIINNPKRDGFVVCFERYINKDEKVFDFFPELDEELIKTEEEAWQLAKLFAEKTHDYCINIYVMDENLTPVKDWRSKRIINVKPLEH